MAFATPLSFYRKAPLRKGGGGIDKANEMIGQELIVMVEGQVAGENAYVCRTYRDAPGVDGYLFLNTAETLVSGDFARVCVTGAMEYDLIGELVE